jgi:N-acetylglucosamine-6-phosphate deacetylase
MTGSLCLTAVRLHDCPAAGLFDVVVSEGRIESIASAGEAAAAASAAGNATVVDAGGRTVIPGLIDLHVHGAGGADLMDGTAEALATMAGTLAHLGTTAFLATGFMRPDGSNEHLRLAAAHVGSGLGGAELLGLHLEGPFVNPVRIGGLPPECVWPITTGALDEVLAATGGALRMMTVAPELDGGLDLVRSLAAGGVVPSIGHTDATYEESTAAIAAGASHVTHLYNAMAPFHHRAPGPLVAIHDAEHVTVQLVSDDVHVGSAVVRWTQRIFGVGRCICVTDGIRTAGLPDGRHRLGGHEYDSYEGVARYADGRLIGTSLPLLEIVLRFRDYTGCSVADAVSTATQNPARVLGLESRKGRLAPGFDADLVILEGDVDAPAVRGGIRPWVVVVGGKVVARAAGVQAALPG